MSRKYLLISLPNQFTNKFNNMLTNLNRTNSESDGVFIEGEYGEKPEYVAIPKVVKYE